MSKQYVKLIMVTPDNNNKFYEMTWEGGSTFTVNYGRVESTSTTITYPYSQWDKKYREKTAKGYKDVTKFISTEVTKSEPKTKNDIGIIDDKTIATFMKLMQSYTDDLVSDTYSVKAENVSQAQVDEAQSLIDKILALKNAKQKDTNDLLIELYTVIPRKMRNVKDNLLPLIDLKTTMAAEQNNLDAMASQVAALKPKKADKTVKVATKNILDRLGLTMKEITGHKDLDYLMKQIKGSGEKLKHIFEVSKPAEDKTFETWLGKQKDKRTRILIHGTQCTSVIPILQIGLKIRPSGNFQFSGKAYGNGNYFSEHLQKSLGYTSMRDQIILVFEVHTGNPYVYSGWYTGNSFTLSYNELQKRGYDSTFVKAGNGLQNSEIIAYKEDQCRIKYIMWFA